MRLNYRPRLARVVALLALALAVSPRVTAQPDPAPALRFRSLTVADGLSQNSIYDIHQDRDGFLWFGTQTGLNRYDGYGFTAYKGEPFDTTSLSGHNVFSLAETADGALWVGTDRGFNRLDKATGTFRRYLHTTGADGGLRERMVWSLLVDRAGFVWAGTTDGLFRLDPRTGRARRFGAGPSGFTDRMAYALHEGPDGAVWTGTRNGLCRLDPTTDAARCYLSADPPEEPLYGDLRLHVPSHPSVRAGFVTSIAADPADEAVLWVTTEDGLVRFDTRTGRHERLRPEQGSHRNVLMDLTPDPERPGVFWVASLGGGLYWFDAPARRFTAYRPGPTSPGLTGSHLLSIHVDRLGTAWAGGAGYGVFQFAPGGRAFFHLHRLIGADGQPLPGGGFSVRAVTSDAEGRLWAGISGGAARLDARTGRVLARVEGLRAPDGEPARPRSLIFDADSALWAGTYGGGLYRREPSGRVRHYRFDPADPHSLAGDFVSTLYRTRDGAVWVGTMDGLSRYDPARDRFVTYRHDPAAPASLSHPNVSAIYEGADGVLWVATFGGGLNRFDRPTGRFAHVRHRPGDPASLSSNYVMAIHERPREPGVLWLAMTGGGLVRYDAQAGRARHYTERDGLVDQTIYGVLEDDGGRLWLSGNRGLSQFDPEAEAFTTYRLGEGPQAGEYEYNAHHRIPQTGLMVFGGLDGFDVFHPDRVAPNPHPPAVVFTGLRVFGDPIGLPHGGAEAVALGHDENTVTFEFAGLHFKNPEANRYAYRLDGVDDGWVEAGTRRTATYAHLAPGQYTFRVRAASADGVWNEEGAGLAVVVRPPWWQTRWARAMFGLLVALALVGAAYGQRAWVVRRERERAGMREARVRAEAAEERAVALRELDAAKGRFFANISHEFRTPLTLILGAVDGLDSEAAGAVRRSARRLLRLVGQLLDLARLEAGRVELRPEPGHPGAFVREQVQAFVPLAERAGVALSVCVTGEEAPVLFDRDAVEKVVMNLVSNAIKYTPEGGKVVVAISQDAGTVEVTVKDTGPGIPPERLGTLFRRFEQVRFEDRQQGAGLGLALTKELVELMGGALSVETEVGLGSAFTARLPLESVAPGASAAILSSSGDGSADVLGAERVGDVGTSGASTAEVSLAEAAAAGPLVLVVDDHPEVRALLRRTLTPAYRVAEAADGEAALEMVREHRPDLILSDVMMPRLDGFGLCRALRADADLRGLPVLLLTARATAEDAVEGLLAGADDYVSKPFHAGELRARIARLLGREPRGSGSEGGGATVALPLQVVVPSAEEAFVRDVLRVAGEHLGDPDFSADALSAEVGLSSRQLTRRLKEAVGQTPGSLLRELRLTQAALLLERDAGTVSEVAYRCGFRSATYFSRAFKGRFGRTPSAYGEAQDAQ